MLAGNGGSVLFYLRAATPKLFVVSLNFYSRRILPALFLRKSRGRERSVSIKRKLTARTHRTW